MGNFIIKSKINPKALVGFVGWCILALVLFSGNVFAQSGCVGWYSTNSSGQVSYYNPVSASYTTLGTYSASTNINAAAIQPSTGDVYFVNRATSKLVAYDVTNNSFATRAGTLPALGTIVGAAFNNSGVLYVMYDEFRLITVDPATGSQTGSTITYTGVPGDGAFPAGTNGDIVFDGTGQMWMVGDSSSTTRRLYRVSISGTTATATAATPTITGLSGAIVGLAINPVTGVFYVITAGGTYSLNSTSGVATSVSTGTGNDLASCGNAPSAPTVSKAFSPTSATAVPATTAVTLTFPNSNFTENFLSTNFVDTLPTGMTVASPSGLSGTCTSISGNSVTANAGATTITFAAGGRIPSGGCTITVNTTVSSFGTYTNTITSGSLRTIIGDYSVEASAVFTAAPPPDLTLTKSHSGNFTVGSTGNYSFSVNNAGGTATSGTISVADTLPTGLTVNGGAVGTVTPGGTNAANWTCNSDAASPQVITCTSSTAIAAAASSVFNFSVNVGSGTAVGTNSITNTATVSGGGETNTANNSGNDPTTVLAPNLSIDKSHTGNFTRGSTGTYSVAVSNGGTAASSGTITVTDTLPTGLTVNSGAAGSVTLGGTNAANWGCNSNSASPQVITCTSSNAIAVSGSSTFSFSVNVALSTLGSVTNSIAVAGGGEATSGTGNNSDTDPTTVITPISCSNVYATAFSGGRTSLYRLDGSTMTAIYTGPQNVGGLAISSNGSAYYDDGTFTNPPLYRFDGTNQTNTGMFMPNLLVGQAADGAGNVYYIDGTYHLRKAPAGGSGNAQDLGAIIFEAGDTIGPSMQYGDMIFDGSGRLYWYGSIASGAGKTYLYVIDPITLAAKDVGDIGPDGATGVAFDSTGKLITTSNAGATVISVDLGSSNLNGTTIGTASPTVYDMGGCSAPILNPNLAVSKSVVNITKSQTPATIAQSGDILEYTVVVTNNGNMPSYDATVADAIPTGTTYVAGSTLLNGTTVADVSGVMPYVTAREVNSSGQPNGVITAGGNTATVKFRVTVNASGLPANITNTATSTFPTVSGGITTTNTINSNTTTTPSALLPPNVGLVKSCPFPADCTTAPQLPGTDITYKIEFTNTGGQSAANMAIVDNVPGNMDFKLGSAAVNLGSTGLTFVIEYSSDYDPLNPTFATWTYTPISGGGGASAGYDRSVLAIRWRVTAGNLSNVSPNNIGDVSFISKIR